MKQEELTEMSREVAKSLMALYLEVPEKVAEDINNKVSKYIAILENKLTSTPKVNLVEVEKLVQNKADFLYGMDDTGSRKGCVDYLRQLCNYTLADLTSEKEEGG